MQVGWMPASSPGGTAGRYDACNLFLLPPIFFPPLDQLLLIPTRRREHRSAEREKGGAEGEGEKDARATSPGGYVRAPVKFPERGGFYRPLNSNVGGSDTGRGGGVYRNPNY